MLNADPGGRFSFLKALGVNPTEAGVQRLDQLVNASQEEIRQAVKSSTAGIDPYKVAARTNATRARLLKQVNPQSDLATIDNVERSFVNHPTVTSGGAPIGPPRMLSALEAQDLKTGTYKQLRGKYGELGSADVEGQKDLARGLKEELESAVPGIRDMNQNQAALVAALDAAGRRSALSGNADPIGFAWAANHSGSFLAALIDRSPIVKSMIARGMWIPAGKAAKVDPQLIRLAVASMVSANDKK